MIENRRQVAQLKRDFAPELVHINSYGRSVLFHLNTTGAHRAPVLVTLHQALPDEPVAHDGLLGHLLRTADWVTACSNAVLTHARRLMPGDPSMLLANLQRDRGAARRFTTHLLRSAKAIVSGPFGCGERV